jgi:hypothetical protein
LQDIPGDKFLAICTTDVSKGLINYARDNNIGIISFTGFVDVRYFLSLYHRLLSIKSAPVAGAESPIAWSTDEQVVPETKKSIGINDKLSDKTVLITSAFDQNNSLNELLNPQASKAFFELFGTGNLNKFVLPTLTIHNLGGHLKEMPTDLGVWTHFGHGRPTGLQGFDGMYHNTEEWLEGFYQMQKSLRLAFFFSCNSINIAKKFVKAGVRLAVGFDSKVLMDDCMDLAKIVIPQALNGDGDERIVIAFNQRCATLGNTYKLRCRPRIYQAAQL